MAITTLRKRTAAKTALCGRTQRIGETTQPGSERPRTGKKTLQTNGPTENANGTTAAVNGATVAVVVAEVVVVAVEVATGTLGTTGTGETTADLGVGMTASAVAVMAATGARMCRQLQWTSRRHHRGDLRQE